MSARLWFGGTRETKDRRVCVMRGLDWRSSYLVGGAGRRNVAFPVKMMAMATVLWRQAPESRAIISLCGSLPAGALAGTQLAAELLARRYSARTRRRLGQLGAAVGLLPWAVFVLIASKGAVVTSLRQLELFQDSGNPGYFLIKLALWVMAA